MKGLLLKDYYMIKKYCRTYLIAAVMFTMLFCFGGGIFLLFYPCLMSGMIPMTLQSYDEKEKWSVYSRTLPYSPAQLVSVKYIIGLILTVISTAIIIGICFLTSRTGSSVYMADSDFLKMSVAVSVAIGLLSPSIIMPCIFRFGVEKGRMAYYIILVAAGVALGLTDTPAGQNITVNPAVFFTAGTVILLGIFVLSWYLSVRFLAAREV